ncbi:MAG: hypothetical protein HKM98_06525 [Gammaproteobacteria bacterium]|nr:hypothetical protein [Gammaproteobacteria bacterium]
MNDAIRDEPTRGYWIISIVALLWNLLGVMAYMMHVTLTAEDFAAMGEAERALYTGAPTWVTGAYAIAVFGGTLGCIALLLRKSWAAPVFVISLIAILAQMGYSLLMTDVIEVMGAGSVIMPLVVIAIGVYLVMFARGSKKRGILS